MVSGFSAASGLQPGRDLVERLVPGDALEFAFSLLADAPQRVEQAIGGVGALEVVRDLGAQRAVGERHRRVALDLRRDAVFDRDEHRAGVGAVVRASDTHDIFGGHSGAHGGFYAAAPRRASRSSGAPAPAPPPCRCVRQPMFAVAICSRSALAQRRELAAAQLAGDRGLQQRVGARRAAAQVGVAHRRELEAGARQAALRPCRVSAGRAAACRASGRRFGPPRCRREGRRPGSPRARSLRQRRRCAQPCRDTPDRARAGGRTPSPSRRSRSPS